jgi:hypothetical protein
MKEIDRVDAFRMALNQQNTEVGLESIEKLQNKQKLERLRDEFAMAAMAAMAALMPVYWDTQDQYKNPDEIIKCQC